MSTVKTPEQNRKAALAELSGALKTVLRNLRRLRGRDTHLAGGQVSHAQFELLIELYERGPLSAGELAAAAQLTPATVTQMLDHLAHDGLVARTRSDTDRRVVVSALTDLGRQRIEDKRAAWQQRWEQALDGMTVEELTVARRALERVASMFDDAPPGSCERG